VAEFSFSISKAAVDNCKGDYVSPVNKICAEVLQNINNVRNVCMCMPFLSEVIIQAGTH
jgi:hypothetical protein